MEKLLPTRNTSRLRSLALAAGASTLLTASSAFAVDVVSFSRDHADSIASSADEGGGHAIATNTYRFSALNNELNSSFFYNFGVSGTANKGDRTVSSFIYARTAAKVFDYDNETASVFVRFTGRDTSSAVDAKIEAVAYHNGNVLDQGVISSNGGVLNVSNSVMTTQTLDLVNTSKDFPVGPATVTVKAHVTGSINVPVIGQISPRGISATIEPFATINLDATGQASAWVLAGGLRASHVSLMSLGLPTTLNAMMKGACVTPGDCRFDVSGGMDVNIGALGGKLEAFVDYPSTSQTCGFNLITAIFPIWSCFLVPGKSTATRTIWESAGASTSVNVWNLNTGFNI